MISGPGHERGVGGAAMLARGGSEVSYSKDGGSEFTSAVVGGSEVAGMADNMTGFTLGQCFDVFEDWEVV